MWSASFWLLMILKEVMSPCLHSLSHWWWRGRRYLYACIPLVIDKYMHNLIDIFGIFSASDFSIWIWLFSYELVFLLAYIDCTYNEFNYDIFIKIIWVLYHSPHYLYLSLSTIPPSISYLPCPYVFIYLYIYLNNFMPSYLMIQWELLSLILDP